MSPRRAGSPGFLRGLVVCSLLCCVALARADAPPDLDVIDLSPETTSQWTPKYVVAPLIALFRGRSYVYAQRRIEIDTTPPGGYVDLFYVRSGFQKRYEQAEAPVVVLIPSRLETGPRDAVTIRAFAEGYRQRSVTFRARDAARRIVLDLEPLPNRLEDVRHRYFAGRASIGFLTKEALTFRLQESGDGLGVILTETAESERAREAVATLRNPLVAEGYGQQLGEDLLVRVVLTGRGQGEGIEIRSRQAYDAPRDLHEFALDLVPSDGGAGYVERARQALARLSQDDVRGCALAFDAALRGALEPSALARALSPRGSFVDPYVRAAMRRLGELSVDGVVDFEGGEHYRPGVPIELEMSLTRADAARGFLALLRRFVEQLEVDVEARAAAYRGLVAPDASDAAWTAALAAAESAETACRERR